MMVGAAGDKSVSPATFRGVVIVLYLAAAILIGRATVTQNDSPISLDDYSMDRAAMPYQGRYMLVPVLRWADRSALMNRAAKAFNKSARSPTELLLQGLNSACLIGMGWLTLRIRRQLLPQPAFAWLAPWLMLWVVAITFVVRYDQRLFLPYDFLSMFFFNVGLVACLEGSGWLLLLMLAAGTYNRETTLFLLPIWLACQWRPRAIRPMAVAALGLAIWFAVKLHLRLLVHGAPAGLQFNWNWNLAAVLLPHHWSQLLSVGGYLALPLWLRRDLVEDRRLRRLWLGSLPFLLATLIFGVWNETRIFGELSILVAVTAAVEFETLVRSLNKVTPREV